jgi:general secretion pathway protein G
MGHPMPNGEVVTNVVGRTPSSAHGLMAGLRDQLENDCRRGRRLESRGTAPLLGFTLIELMVVMAVIAVLMAIAVPIYTRSIQRSKESVLKNNLFTLRTVIDEYTYDKQKAPQTLQDLVSDGYLRQVPMDPMTGNSDSWKLVMEDATNTVNQTEPGIFDVRSGSDGTSLEGTPYAEW